MFDSNHNARLILKKKTINKLKHFKFDKDKHDFSWSPHLEWTLKEPEMSN